jgi:hypothetical protein
LIGGFPAEAVIGDKSHDTDAFVKVLEARALKR